MSSVGTSNMPRRGNQPMPVNSWSRSIWAMKLIASPMSVSTMNARDHDRTRARRARNTHARCRARGVWRSALPRERDAAARPCGRGLRHRGVSASSGGWVEDRRTGRASELARPGSWTERGNGAVPMAGRPRRPGWPSSVVGRQVHVADGLEDLTRWCHRPGSSRRSAATAGVLGRLGLVHVDEQGAGQRVRPVGDRLGGRRDARRRWPPRRPGSRLTVSLFSSANAKPTQPSEVSVPAMPCDDHVVVRGRGVVGPRTWPPPGRDLVAIVRDRSRARRSSRTCRTPRRGR